MWEIKRWTPFTALPFIALGVIFIIVGMNTGAAEKTADGHSLKWFWYIMGFWFTGLTLLVYGGIYYWVARSRRKLRRLDSEGIRGFATVISSGATGTETNNIPVVEMELEVSPEGRQPYLVKIRDCVNPVNLSRVQAGTRLPVLVDPGRPGKVMIDWGAPDRDRASR